MWEDKERKRRKKISGCKVQHGFVMVTREPALAMCLESGVQRGNRQGPGGFYYKNSIPTHHVPETFLSVDRNC